MQCRLRTGHLYSTPCGSRNSDVLLKNYSVMTVMLLPCSYKKPLRLTIIRLQCTLHYSSVLTWMSFGLYWNSFRWCATTHWPVQVDESTGLFHMCREEYQLCDFSLPTTFYWIWDFPPLNALNNSTNRNYQYCDFIGAIFFKGRIIVTKFVSWNLIQITLVQQI